MLREVLQVLRSEYAFALITASLAVLVAVIAFELVGYLGLAMLGLLTLLVCANVEFERLLLIVAGLLLTIPAEARSRCPPGEDWRPTQYARNDAQGPWPRFRLRG